MNRWKSKPGVVFYLVLLLLPLLALLASLQIRWLGAVSRAEQARMRSSLQVGAERFKQDIDAELTRLYVTFQVDADALNADRPDYSSAYSRWLMTATWPGLAKEIYWIRESKNGVLELMDFDRERNVVSPVAWPAYLEGLRSGFEQQLKSPRSGALVNLFNSLTPVLDDIPAVLIPATHQFKLAKLMSHDKPVLRSTAYTLVVLDDDYIKSRLLPELMQRHLAHEGSLDYDLWVTSISDPTRVIYQSVAGDSNEKPTSGDISIELFGLKSDDGSGSPTGELRRQEVGAQDQERAGNRQAPTVTDSQSPPVLFIRSEDNNRWKLILRHRAGSLETVVASTMRRNLFIFFIVLILLATSIVLIVILTRRMSKLARQQMQFVAGVSHELNTPLSVIRAAAQNLADGVLDDVQEVREYGELIDDEGRKLSEMIGQILYFVGLQSGNKKYTSTPLEVEKLVETALAPYESLIFERRLTIESHFSPDLPMVMGDKGALERCIQNILSNAIKYSGASGSVSITGSVGINYGNRVVLLAIKDKGPGISNAELPHIFEPFYRGERAIESQIPGNGLGLSLVKEVVKTHGGDVVVHSKLGIGTTFTLKLPVMSDGESGLSAAYDEVSLSKE